LTVPTGTPSWRATSAGAVPDGYDLLFVVRADGQLLAVTAHQRPAPERGDTLVLLSPASQA
jgi:hypothetical protein